MQVNELKEQLAGPSRKLFIDDGAGVDMAREVGLSVGEAVFDDDDPAKVIEGIANMEACFHHLRSTALTALKDHLVKGYRALAVIVQDEHGVAVQLANGEELPLPGHTAPALNELIMKLEPAEGSDNPRLCLELIQQVARLMQVMGMDRITLRD